jgi:transcriptional regulator with XRE-family HTH domain
MSAFVILARVDDAGREAFREERTQVFGGNLKRERKKAKLTQEALGEKADLNRTHVGYLERGKRTPELPTICRLADALGISAGLLVDPPGAKERLDDRPADSR